MEVEFRVCHSYKLNHSAMKCRELNTVASSDDSDTLPRKLEATETISFDPDV